MPTVGQIAGMLPQGPVANNPDWIQRATDYFNHVKACPGLQDIIDIVIAHEQATLNSISEEIALAKAIWDFIQDPIGSIEAILEFLIKVYFSQALTYPTLLSKLVRKAVEIEQLIQAIEGAIARLPQCTLTVPGISGLPTGPITIPTPPVNPYPLTPFTP